MSAFISTKIKNFPAKIARRVYPRASSAFLSHRHFVFFVTIPSSLHVPVPFV